MKPNKGSPLTGSCTGVLPPVEQSGINASVTVI